MRKSYWSCLAAAAILMSACEKDATQGELYKKQVYMVRSGVLSADVMFGAENPAFVSVYVSGVAPNDRDVNVGVEVVPRIVDSLNDIATTGTTLYTPLPAANYKISNMSVTVKSGEEYARLPFTITTHGLDARKDYVLPVSIARSSEFEVVQDKKWVLYHLVFNNQFSGAYSMTGLLGAESIGKEKTLRAMSENSLEMYADKVFEDTVNAKYNILLTIAADRSVTLTSGMEITATGVNKYLPDTKTFLLDYTYKDPVSGELKRVQETLVKIAQP
ncbi:BT_3044 domain-containing protein [Chitinophaga sp. NPDC101104]|uniref:BT_3044 domain-containing protein n=1 Tax=Chitinophaga sp. NPDC101104 TaxID=3390561 RepID=UPI003D08BFE3